jgi:hypothetical protein
MKLSGAPKVPTASNTIAADGRTTRRIICVPITDTYLSEIPGILASGHDERPDIRSLRPAARASPHMRARAGLPAIMLIQLAGLAPLTGGSRVP